MLIFKQNFASSSLYQQRTESMKGFLTRRWSFWLALFSCVAFLMGNMVGQHGWSAFWKSVWGKEAEIVFAGTAPPILRIPDPERWSPAANHQYNYSDVPESFFIPLPVRRPSFHCGEQADNDRRVFSVQYNGDYESGGEGCGSHPAEDILVPKGTPVHSIMNGVVDRIEERDWGFGNTVVIRHIDVPDPDKPGSLTTLYSNYSHLGRIIVSVGQTITKSQQIAVSGQSGLATAPHLHLQIDTADAPFHPYWPFTTDEATRAGLSFMQAVDAGLGQRNAERYTVNPLAYVASYMDYSVPTVIAHQASKSVPKEVIAKAVEKKIVVASSINITQASPTLISRVADVVESISPQSVRKLMRARRLARTASRLARLREQEVTTQVHSMNLQPETSFEFVPTTTAESNIPMPIALGKVASISVFNDKTFDREWEEIVLFARDSDGNFIHDVAFDGKLYIESTFGNAEFSPSALTEEQFDERGRAFVKMLPRGHKTIIPSVRGVFSADGNPMIWEQRSAAQKVATAR